MTRHDLVVIGAGSAGAVLAGRCSERPETSVLLLEAGPDHDTAGAPAGVRAMNFFRSIMEPDRIWPNLVATRRAEQAPSLYVRGRGAGGSSSVNAMGALRGTPDDYEHWAHDLGCEGWGWPEMFAAFLRCEDDLDYGGDGVHGKGGPIPLGRRPLTDLAPIDRALRDGFAALGHPIADDYHAPGATGIHRWAVTARDGARVSTNDAYVEPARRRPNLTVRGGALVDRVLFDGRRAVGVLLAGGEEIEAQEVIVAAGAIHSPAILLRSGVDDLPVGAGLKDHAATPGFELALAPAARMTSSDASLLQSLVRYSSGLADAGPNDMQFVWFPCSGPTDEGVTGARLIGAVMRVYSAGAVRLRSADPNDDPIVEFNFLSDDRDRVRLRDAVHRMMEVVEHPCVAPMLDDCVALTTPLHELRTDDAIDGWLSANVTDYVHATGTCRMGRAGDPAAVVDTACRLIGYDNIRVCDASVMPELPRANTHLTTVAIAERLAEILAAEKS